MMECSKYRMAPLCFKDYYYYYASVISNLIDNKEIWNIDNDYPFYEKLMKKEYVGNKPHRNVNEK